MNKSERDFLRNVLSRCHPFLYIKSHDGLIIEHLLPVADVEYLLDATDTLETMSKSVKNTIFEVYNFKIREIDQDSVFLQNEDGEGTQITKSMLHGALKRLLKEQL